jgi:hypothetical protein
VLRNVIICIMLLLAACNGPPIINTVIQRDIPVAVPDAQPMTLNPVEWQVLNIAQLKALAVKLQSMNEKNVVVFVLDDTNYVNLSLNFEEIQRYLKEQKVILGMLKQIIAQRAGQTITTDDKKK